MNSQEAVVMFVPLPRKLSSELAHGLTKPRQAARKRGSAWTQIQQEQGLGLNFRLHGHRPMENLLVLDENLGLLVWSLEDILRLLSLGPCQVALAKPR